MSTFNSIVLIVFSVVGIVNLIFFILYFLNDVFDFYNSSYDLNRVFIINVKSGEKLVFTERQFKKLKFYFDMCDKDFIKVIFERDFYSDKD